MGINAKRNKKQKQEGTIEKQNRHKNRKERETQNWNKKELLGLGDIKTDCERRKWKYYPAVERE